MTRTSTQRFVICSWMVALLIGLVFAGLEFGLRFEIEGVNATGAPSWLDLALFLCGYLFVFCLKPIQAAIQRKLCQRAAHRTHRKMAR